MVQGNVSAFEAAVADADAKLQAVRTDGEAAITEEDTKIRHKVGAELGKLRKDLTTRFDSTKAEMETVVGGIENTVHELRNSTTDDYYDGLQFEERVRNAVEKDIQDITAEADAAATGGATPPQPSDHVLRVSEAVVVAVL